jgi:hypothetical protein
MLLILSLTDTTPMNNTTYKNSTTHCWSFMPIHENKHSITDFQRIKAFWKCLWINVIIEHENKHIILLNKQSFLKMPGGKTSPHHVKISTVHSQTSKALWRSTVGTNIENQHTKISTVHFQTKSSWTNKYNRKNCYIFPNNICLHFERFFVHDCKQCLHLWWRMCPTFCFELFHTLVSKQIEHFPLLNSFLRFTTQLIACRTLFASCTLSLL